MNIAILGLGYTGSRIHQQLVADKFSVTAFSRNSGNIMDLSGPLDDPFASCIFDRLLVTFPLYNLPPENIIKLASSAKHSYLFSSTGIFKRNQCFITEDSEKDFTHKRYASEKTWLETGGKIIYLSGIYGSNRNPVDWLRNGKVSNSGRQLNMIHLQDITNYTIQILQKPEFPREIILSDGQIHSWQNIHDFCVHRNLLKPQPVQLSEKENVFIVPGQLFRQFPDVVRRDFWQELDKLNPLSPSSCHDTA